MKNPIIILMFLSLFLISCGEDNLPEDYEVSSCKILAVKVDEVESRPGDTVFMTLLVSGVFMDQDSLLPVTWQIGDAEDNVLYEEVVPYNEPFELDIPMDILADEARMDIPVTATVTIEGRSLSSFKRFRITQTPVGKNPQISSISIGYTVNGELNAQTVYFGDTITVYEDTKNVSLTAQTRELEAGANDTLVYRWYFTTSQNSSGSLEMNDQTDDIEVLLGKGVKAADYQQSIVLSLYGEKAEKDFQPGRYTVYLVIRDNAAQSNTTSEDRLGTDFYYFTLNVERK